MNRGGSIPADRQSKVIVLTGDVHHSSLKTGNQRASDIPEAVAAQRALRLAEQAGVKLTYFLSGRSLVEEWDLVKPLCESESVELGGHNWSCFQPAILHRACLKLMGSYNGPAWLQRRDARRTIAVIRQRTGRRRRRAWHWETSTPTAFRRCAFRPTETGLCA